MIQIAKHGIVLQQMRECSGVGQIINGHKVGVGSESLPLSLNDAIKRALENNNDIEVARDDVRFAETQLRALEGIFDPVFEITPQYDKRISPVQSQLSGGGS